MTVQWQVGMTLEDLEKKAVLRALEIFGNNKEKAAQALGVSLKTIYNKLEKYEGKEVSEDSTIHSATEIKPEILSKNKQSFKK